MDSNEIEIAENSTIHKEIRMPDAIKNASVSIVAPHIVAITDCFINPKNLITKEKSVTHSVDFKMLLSFFIDQLPIDTLNSKKTYTATNVAIPVDKSK